MQLLAVVASLGLFLGTLSVCNGSQFRIVGGQTAYTGQFPHQISLIRETDKFCGGSVISQLYIVTAGHCASRRSEDGFQTYQPSDIQVRVGSNSLMYGGQIVEVAEIKVHPYYKFPRYDIALLALTEPLTYSDKIKPIPLANKQPPPGVEFTVSGWGYLTTDGEVPNKLQFVQLRTMSDEQCENFFGAVVGTIFCGTHKRKRGICQGDSGGPAEYNGTLLGVTSFSTQRCGDSAPDGFTKVPLLHDWITENSDLNG